MIYIAILAPVMILCIVFVLKGTSVKMTDEHITIGYCRYSITRHTFSAKKLWIRPIKGGWRLRCVVQVAVFQDKTLIRTHSIMIPNEEAADALLAKMEACCNLQSHEGY